MRKVTAYYLRKLRREMDISQEKMAKEMDIKRATISRYETGGYSPPLDLLNRFIIRLGGSWSELAKLIDEENRKLPKTADEVMVEHLTDAEKFRNSFHNDL